MQYRDSHIAVPSRGQLSVLLLNSASSPGPEAQCAAPATSSVRRHIYYLATSTRTSLSIPGHRVEYSILFLPADLTHSPHCAVSELQLLSHEAVGFGTDDTLEVVTFSSISILKPHCEERDRTSGRHAESTCTRAWRDDLITAAAISIQESACSLSIYVKSRVRPRRSITPLHQRQDAVAVGSYMYA